MGKGGSQPQAPKPTPPPTTAVNVSDASAKQAEIFKKKKRGFSDTLLNAGAQQAASTDKVTLLGGFSDTRLVFIFAIISIIVYNLLT